MDSTKYQVSCTPSEEVGAAAAASVGIPQQREPAGAVADRPLVWIEEHLTDNFLEPRYHQASSQGHLVENWFVESGYTARLEGEKTPVLKIQKFKSGGYEATCRMLDLEKIGRAMNSSRRRGKREQEGERDPESIKKAGQRAKRRCRYAVKNMGATNLVTLTRREGPNTRDWTDQQWEAWENGGRQAWESKHGRFWSAEQWAKAWDRLRRLLSRILGDFPYVGVLEEHRKGNYHLHLAWCGKVNLNVMRPLWWGVCGGRGEGNVDSKYIKVARGCARSAVIARYISKYVTKHFEEEGRFNKKRYWASRQDLPEVQRYILNQPDAVAALVDRYELMDMNVTDRHNFFVFPDGTGWWWNFIPEIHASPPPF